jgi:hydrophobe/amphiphile efflux-1 (HAE1) family protein
MTKLAINRPILFIVLFLFLGLAGIFSYSQLRYELLPDIDAPFVTVSTLYPGASPAEVESGITRRIEEAIAGTDKIKRVVSSSGESISTIIVEFRQGTNPDIATQNIQRKVNEILPLLPSAAKAPSVLKYSINDIPVLQIGLKSTLPPAELSDIVRRVIQQRISRLPGIGNIIIAGDNEKILKVEINAQQLKLKNILPQQIVQALSREHINIPAGSFKSSTSDIALNISGKEITPEKFANIIIRTYPDGSFTKLSDIAAVYNTIKQNNTYSYIDSNQAVLMQIYRQADANPVEVSKLCRREIDAINLELQGRVKVDIAQDASEFTLEAAHDVDKDLIIAIILVALVMFIFLHSLRNSLIVMIAIPSSILSTFLIMYILGFTLNLMTLLALSLVIGILVDDSIVVLENIYHHIEKGKHKAQAALDGRNEIGFAALAVTLVDVVVFVPLALTPGLTGSIVRQFSLVIVISTLFSLLVSFTLTPMLASRFAKLESINPNSLLGRVSLIFEKSITQLTTFYSNLLERALHYRKTIFFVSFLLFAASLLLPFMGYIGAEFAPATDKGEIVVTLELPAGTTLQKSSETARDFYTKLNKMKEIKRIINTVGISSDGSVQNPRNITEFTISFIPRQERALSLNALADSIRSMAVLQPGIKARISPVGIFGGGNAEPIQVIISGADRDSLRSFAQSLADSMQSIPGTQDIRLSANELQPEYQLIPDREKAARFGISTEDIGMAVRMGYNGYDELTVQQADRQTSVHIQFREQDRQNPDLLKQLPVAFESNGKAIQLNQITKSQTVFAYASLERKDRSNAITIFCKPADGRPVGDIGQDIQQKVAGMHVPDGIQILYGGDLELQDDSFDKLAMAFGAAIIMVYFVMVALYNSWLYPFVILFSVPVATVGAFIALALAGKTINIFSIFGLIMMIGLVAKNGILLVDRINENRTNDMELFDAVQEAGKSRLRPILMTTLAMVIGMLPIAMAGGACGELKSGLGWVLVGGLSSSMLLTLLLVPTVYVSLSSFQKKNKSKKTITVAAIIILASIAKSQYTHAEQPLPFSISLEQAIELVSSKNPEILMAAQDQKIAAMRQSIQHSSYLPTIDIQGQYTHNLKQPVFFLPALGFDASGNLTVDESNVQPVIAALRNTASVGINLQMPLYSARLNALTQAMGLGVDISKEQFKSIKAQKISEIKKLYAGLLFLQMQIDLLRQHSNRAAQILQESRNLLRQGMNTDADTLRAFVQFKSIEPAIQKMKVALLRQKQEMSLLMGMKPDTDFIVLDSLHINLWKSTQMTVPDNIQNNPVYRQAAIAIDMAQVEQNAEQARYIPELSLFGSWLGQGQSTGLRFSPFPTSAAAGVQLNWRIFDGLNREYSIQEKEIALIKSRMQLEQQENQLKAGLQLSAYALQEAAQRMQAEQLQIDNANRSFNLQKSRFSVGIGKQSDIQDAGIVLLQAQSNYAQAVLDYLLARADAEVLTGLSANGQ